MIQTSIFTDAYTHTLRQHSNVFLGCLQLLFWFVFRTIALRYFIMRMTREQLFRFAFQVLILLTLFCSLVIGAIYLGFNGFHTLLMYTVVALVVFLMVSVAYALLGMRKCLDLGMELGKILGAVGGFVFFFRTGLVLANNQNETVFLMIIVWASLTALFVGGITGSFTGRLAGFIVACLTIGIVIGIPIWVSLCRSVIMAVLLIPWNALLYYVDAQHNKSSSSLLSKNLAFWDEWQFLPIWGLDKHLILVIEKNPIEGQAALNYLSNSRQRWAAQAVQVELDARQLENCTNAFTIGQIQQILIVSELARPANTMFHSFNRISVDVDAALRQSSAYNRRIAFTAVDDHLNNLIGLLTKSSDKYAVRFRPIAQRWQNIIDLHLQYLIKESELRQEIDSPYIIGVPVTNPQQLFFGRIDTVERLEKLLLDRRSPPLLLYGQRRTGKTSLLNNLGRLLPTSIIPLFVDLQGSISSAKDHTGFLYNLAKAMINSAQRQRNLKLPPLSYETLATDPFTRFDEWLDQLETALAGNTALLALDEFEVLDRVLNEGRFNENDVLGMLRNLIQHRPKFKVLLAGSHTLDEFQRWSSYLINAQVIHLGYLQEAEARQLIETPIENFALRYEPSASQRVLAITKGHPFLVQLLCAEIVALKNDQDPSIRRLATLADVEEAIPAALEHGSMFFSDIEGNQLDTHSLKVLRYLAQQGEGAIISSADLAAHFTGGAEIAEGINGSIELLLRRELIETKPSGYSIQLELIRRWFI
jgi:hypothetical protein